MKVGTLKKIGLAVINVLDEYPPKRRNERFASPVLFALLCRECKLLVSREHHLRGALGAKKPCRIDFRVGGTNPTLLEFAVRPPSGQQEISASANHRELKKLSRFSGKTAKKRFLLLLDFKRTPKSLQHLKEEYDAEHAGRGNFSRNPVRVVYVHKIAKHDFLWKPFKS